MALIPQEADRCAPSVLDLVSGLDQLRLAPLHAHARGIEVCIGEGVVFFRGAPPKDETFLDSALEAVAEVAVALKA